MHADSIFMVLDTWVDSVNVRYCFGLVDFAKILCVISWSVFLFGGFKFIEGRD